MISKSEPVSFDVCLREGEQVVACTGNGFLRYMDLVLLQSITSEWVAAYFRVEEDRLPAWIKEACGHV